MHDLAQWLRDQIAATESYANGLPEEHRRILLDHCQANAALLDAFLGQGHHVNHGDPRATCAAATRERDGGITSREFTPDHCDCGRDDAVMHNLGLLALAYRHRPGYRQEGEE